MISALDISTSALVAQRVRLNTISGNIANISSLKNEDGEASPYQERQVIFQTDDSLSVGGGSGVKVDSIEISEKEPAYRWEPEHPLAIQKGPKKGYVAYPNINMTSQMVDALEATRSYEANVGIIEITKNLGRETLSIIA